MVRARAAFLGSAPLALALTLACGSQAPPADEALVLRGFNVLDPESRRVSQHDVVIERGAVVARPSGPHVRIVEGKGRFLLPALWDLKASLWGNNSLRHYDELTQSASFSRCLELQLYHGVAHVGVFAMQRVWVERELHRPQALERSAAESLYPDVALCAAESFACTPVATAQAAERAIEERQRARVPFVVISFLSAKSEDLRGVSPAVLAAALAKLRAIALPSLVLVDDWASAQRAAELGASVVHGFPEGPVPDALVQTLLEREVAFAPALTSYLEADRLLGSEAARREPLLVETVRPEVLTTFASAQGMWHEWRPTLAEGRARKASLLASVERMAKAGVRLVVASDAGWTAGSFQGYASLATQVWLERAGVEPWVRLSAATLWPARIFGRHAGFAPGDSADFLAVEADPLLDAENLKRISLLVRQGKLVDRQRLRPDLTRSNYLR